MHDRVQSHNIVMADSTTKSGCGVFRAVFGQRTRRSVSTSSLPNVDVPQVLNNASKQKSDSRRKNGSDGAFSDYSSTTEEPQRNGDRIISRPSPKHIRKVTQPVYVQPQQQDIRKTAADTKVGSAGPKIGENGQQHLQSYNRNKRVPQGSTGISGELDAMIDEQRSAYAGNMKVYGNLGNLRQGNLNNVNNKPEERSLPNGMGNINKKPSKETHTPTKPNSYCRALSTRMDPEQLKIMGNEDYKNGRFAEALSLYDAAIFLDPEKASYRSNKSAALTSLGRLLEAVFEAREAIRIEPSYERAHNRLATLYLRLGDPDQTTRHYKHAGSEADPDLIIKAKKLQVHLKRCNEARKLKDWNRLLKETMQAISAGADSALQIYTLESEALIKLHRHHEADQVLSSAPKFEEEDCTKFYGPVCHANLLVVQAQVDLAAGRIDEALEASRMAGKIDSENKDANTMHLRIKAVMDSRSKGNELFKAAKYSQACVAYGEGLYNDSFNSVLLCNRAACRSKLGQFEKAIDDCDMALNIRPSYSKARLRRADCYSKLGKWQESIDDYEVLTREAPENEEVSKALREAKEKLKRQ